MSVGVSNCCYEGAARKQWGGGCEITTWVVRDGVLRSLIPRGGGYEDRGCEGLGS